MFASVYSVVVTMVALVTFGAYLGQVVSMPDPGRHAAPRHGVLRIRTVVHEADEKMRADLEAGADDGFWSALLAAKESDDSAWVPAYKGWHADTDIYAARRA